MARIVVSAGLPSLLEALGASPHPAPQAAGRIQFPDLQVEVCFEEAAWRVLRWQTVSTVEWNTEEQISVWDGKN